MSVIIKLLNLPLQANSIDVRTFFRGLGIPDGGVHIVGLDAGIAFIAFSGDEDARQAMEMSGGTIQGSPVRLLLSSRNEMFKVIEQARQDSLEQARRTSGLSTGISPSNAGNVSGSMRDTNSASAFQSHQPHIPQMPNNSLMGNQNDLVGSTSAFGIPQMNAFTGMMNMSSNNLPHGISAQSPFALPMNNTAQMPPQLNSLLGQPQTGTNTNVFNASMNSGLPPSRSQNQNQAQPFGMMPPYGSSIPPLINTNSQPPLAFPSNMGQSGPAAIGGQHQNGLLGPGHQMHMPPPLGNNMGLSNQALGSGGIQSSGGHFSSGGDRLGMGGGLGNSAHSSSPFNNQNSGFGNHAPATNMGISASGSSPFGIELGNTRVGGRGRVSRFNNVSDEDMGFGRTNPSGGPGIGRGRQSRDMGSTTLTKEKHGYGGGFGRGEAGFSARDRDQSSTTRDRSERSTKRSRSRSRDRRDSRRPPGGRGDKGREESASRDRDRRRRTKSKSRSRSRERERSSRTGRRNSSLETPKINSSPEKNRNDDDKNSSGNDDVLIISEGSDEDFPCVKLTGVPKESSSRDIKDFIRVEIRGGTDGIVRNHEEGLAFIRLQNASDYSKAYRQSGHKIDGSVCRVDGIRLEVWDHAHNTIKLPGFDRDKGRGRDSNRGRERGDRDSRVREYDRSNVRDSGPTTTSTECCLLIQGLPPAFSAKDIALRILTGVRSWVYSEIVIQQVPNEMGRPSVNAYVQIMSLQEAQKIIEAISRTEEGSSLHMQVVDIGELWQAKKMNESTLGGYKDRETSRFNSSGDTKSLFDTDLGSGLETGSGSSSVMLRGVPPNMSERDMVDFFSDIGSTPMNVQMLLDPTGARNGQVICEFQDARRARLATTKDGMTIGRSTISVQLFNRRGIVDAPASVPLLSPPEYNGFPNIRGAPRAGVLGMRPPRFPNPMYRSPNPFIQALQQDQSSRGSRAPGGPRMRGSRFMGRGGGPRMGGGRFESPNGVPGSDDGLGITSTRRIESMFEKTGCVVAVTNIPYSATMDDILRFLAGLLDSEINRDRIIRRYNEFQQATGDARIAFDSPTEAKRALELLTGSTMWNRKLEVSLPSEF